MTSTFDWSILGKYERKILPQGQTGIRIKIEYEEIIICFPHDSKTLECCLCCLKPLLLETLQKIDNRLHFALGFIKMVPFLKVGEI